MTKVRIVGVPEHFNLPWHLCLESGDFNEAGIELIWTDIPEGTGKMCQMLRDNETDLAVILTEGIIRDNSANDNPNIILQEYVASPLLWGIHVADKSTYTEIADLQHRKVAISRLGSGSHLMAIVHAKQQGWDTHNMEFVITDTLEGAAQALTEGRADYFMWERFMTQPLVDQQIFRRVGECPTPWPSFVVVSRKDFFNAHTPLIERLLEVINTTTEEFKYIPSIDRTLATRYNQEIDDIQSWLQLTRWSQTQLSEENYTNVLKVLKELSLIEKSFPYTAMVK